MPSLESLPASPAACLRKCHGPFDNASPILFSRVTAEQGSTEIVVSAVGEAEGKGVGRGRGAGRGERPEKHIVNAAAHCFGERTMKGSTMLGLRGGRAQWEIAGVTGRGQQHEPADCRTAYRIQMVVGGMRWGGGGVAGERSAATGPSPAAARVQRSTGRSQRRLIRLRLPGRCGCRCPCEAGSCCCHRCRRLPPPR